MQPSLPKKCLVAFKDFQGNLKIVPPEQAMVSAFDRSFHFGDSLYEVTRSYKGILFSLDEHMRRLCDSARLAMYEEMPNVEEIKSLIFKAAKAYFTQFGNTDIYVRLTLSRGVGDLNIDRKYSSSPYAMVFVKELDHYPKESYAKGVHYAVVERRRNLPQALDPAMKSGNYLNNLLALCEAKKMGASDAVILNYQGFVTEGTTNNVWAVKDGVIWSPPLSVGILAGITRDWVYEICQKHKMPIEERLFTEAELRACDEMFLTSATKEVMPITLLNHQPVGSGKPGVVTKKLHKHLLELIEEYCKKHKSESLYV